MKILNVAFYGTDNKVGGICLVVESLSKEWRNNSNIVETVLTSNCNYVNGKTVHYYRNQAQFAEYVSRYIPDIVVFHSLYEWQQITYSSILRKFKIPYILVFHGGASCDNAKKGWLKKKIANLIFFNKFIRNASRVVYLNKNELSKSVFRSINDNYAIIPNGIDLPNNPKSIQLNGIMTITFISRMDYYGKGLDVLIPAMKKLKDEGWSDRIRFKLYGTAEPNVTKMLEELSLIADCGGFVTGKAKCDAFEISSINILPSRSEGMPMTILESLSYGRPCIVTRMTNMAELIEENNCGWVIDLTVESIVETIKNAYKDLRENGNAYQQRCRKVASEYSWDIIAKRSINLYLQVIREQ